MVAVVAAGHIRLQLPMSHSLKDKRQVIRSLQSRIREKFGVWPDHFRGVQPCEPAGEVRSWIKSRQIAFAKSKSRRAA